MLRAGVIAVGIAISGGIYAQLTSGGSAWVLTRQTDRLSDAERLRRAQEFEALGSVPLRLVRAADKARRFN